MRSANHSGLLFYLIGFLLFGLPRTWVIFPIIITTTSVQGFSLVSQRGTTTSSSSSSNPTAVTTRDTNRIPVPWTTAQAVTRISQTKRPSKLLLEESRTKEDHSSSTTMTTTQVAAWYLTQQLLLVLQQEESSWSIIKEDGENHVVHQSSMESSFVRRNHKLSQMIRWLNTRLLFGCTALEYVQLAAATTDTTTTTSTTSILEEPSSSDSRVTSEQGQQELQAMLDFSEFDLPYLDNDEDDDDDDYYDQLAANEDEGRMDGTYDPSSPSGAREEDLVVVAQSDSTIQPEKWSDSSPPQVYSIGQPLEIVQSDVPPLQNPTIKETVSEDETCNNFQDENGESSMATTDTGAVNKVENREEKPSDSVPATSGASAMDNKSMNSSTKTTSIEQSPTATKSSVELDLDGVEMNVLRDTKVTEQVLDLELDQNQQTSSMDEIMTEYLGETDDDESVIPETKTMTNNNDEARIYKASALISHSFQTSEFNPPIWTRNGNIQTIGNFLARAKNPALTEFQWDERQQMETPDGDFFVVDWKYSDLDENVGRPSNEVPLVLLCHGLESNSDSYLAKDMAVAFNSVGMDVACINFRGCSDEINRGRLGYHLGFTDDLKFMVDHVSKSRGGSKLYLSGFSLGANVVTKLLAEWGTKAFTNYNIRGAAVNALPFDFNKICPNFSDDGLTKSLYGDGLLKSLQETVLANFDGQNYSFSKEELMNLKTVREFDDLVVCDVYGFDGAGDYHRKCSTISVLDQVAVPELVVQALDDPFFQGNTNPPNNASQPLRIQYTEHGGHCGYLQQEAPGSEASWMPLQLARFLKHVDEQQSSLQGIYGVVPNDSSYTGGTTKQGLDEVGRQRAAQMSHSFPIRDYRPAWFATNPHVQTVLGALYRKETMYGSPDLLSFVSAIPKLNGGGFQWDGFHWDRRQRIETPDNDFFDVDWKTSGIDFELDDTPLVIICHGLQASSDSPLVKDMAQAFLNHGMGAACINFRGCGGEVNLTPRGYHLGFTEDLQQLVLHVNTIYPNKRIFLSAFSLGANVVTTFLANLGSDASKFNIAGAAVNALPYEVSKSTMNLNSDGLTKTLYADRILESMYVRVEEMFDNGVDFGFEREKIRECKTIMDMENLVVAPFFDFQDAWDYYEKTGTFARLDDVVVPQLVIQSEDDPFLLGQTYVEDKADRPLRIHYTKHGGHCGHVLHCTDQAYPTSWMPTELARFLAHVDLSLKSGATTLERIGNQKTGNEILN